MNPRVRYFVEKCVKEEGGCWIWQLSLTQGGYAQARVGHRIVRVHRFLYEELVGSIPEGLVLDHICEVKSCVNPGHMDPVTQLENSHRTPTPIRLKDRCIRGHDDWIEWGGRRRCRICSRGHDQVYRGRQRAAG